MYVAKNAFLHSSDALGKIWLAPPGINYFPITTSLQWAQWQLWGNSTLGYHLTNIGLHLLSAFLFWRLLGTLGMRRAWLGGLLFAVHPLAVESVAWISEVKNALSLPPLLLAMGSYVRFCERGRGVRPYCLALFWFLFAMLCKSTVAMFPAAILLYSWWRQGRLRWTDAKASLPFFAISFGLGLLTVWFEHHRVVDYQFVPPEGMITRVAAAGLAIAFYLEKSVFPVGLLPIYSRWRLDPLSAVQWMPWLAFGCLGLWLYAKRASWGRHAILGLGWFAINLAPVLGLIGMAYLRISRVADHFAYVSLLGVVGMAAAFFEMGHGRPGTGRLARTCSALALACPLALAAALAVETHVYAAVFRDEKTLWTQVLRHNPDAWIAHYDLANILRDEGRLDEAIAHYEQALRIKPDLAEAEDNLGVALTLAGRRFEAIRHYEAALRLMPDMPEVHDNLGLTLANLGRFDEAIAHYEKALQSMPDSAEVHNNLGLALAGVGRWQDAIGQYEEALRLRPDLPAIHSNLADALRAVGKIDEALDQLDQARELQRYDQRSQ